MSLLTKIQQAVSKKKTEHGERNAVSTVLIQHGYTAQPEIERRKQPDNTVVRLYTWYDTPAGDVTLVAGPSIEGEVIQLNPPEVYKEAEPVLAPYEAPRRANRRKKPPGPSRRPSRPSTHAFDHHDALGNPDQTSQIMELGNELRDAFEDASNRSPILSDFTGHIVSFLHGGYARRFVIVSLSEGYDWFDVKIYQTEKSKRIAGYEVTGRVRGKGVVFSESRSTSPQRIKKASLEAFNEWKDALAAKSNESLPLGNPSAMALNIDLPNYSPSDRDEFLKEPLAWLHDDYKVWILSGIGGVPYVSITPKDSDANFVENIRGDFNTIVNAVEVLYQNKGVPWGPREITQQIMRHPGNRALIAALRTKSNPLRSNPPKGPQKKDLWAFNKYSPDPVGIQGVHDLSSDFSVQTGYLVGKEEAAKHDTPFYTTIIPKGTEMVYFGDIVDSVVAEKPSYSDWKNVGSVTSLAATIVRYFLKGAFGITSSQVKASAEAYLADFSVDTGNDPKQNLTNTQAALLREAFMFGGNYFTKTSDGHWRGGDTFKMLSKKGVQKSSDPYSDTPYHGAAGWLMPAKYANYVAALTASAFKANSIPLSPEAGSRLRSKPGPLIIGGKGLGLKSQVDKEATDVLPPLELSWPGGQTAADKFFAEGETPKSATPAYQADSVVFNFLGTFLGIGAVLYLTGPTYALKDSILKPAGFNWSGKFGKKKWGVPKKVWYYPTVQTYEFWSGLLESLIPQILKVGNTFSLDWDDSKGGMIAGETGDFWVKELKKHLIETGVVSEVEEAGPVEEDYAEKIMDDLGLGEEEAEEAVPLKVWAEAQDLLIELKEPGINKQSDWEDYVKQLASPSDYMQTTAFVEQKKELTPAAYDAFVVDFFKDYSWLKGKGGNNSTYKVPAKYADFDVYNLPEDIRKKWIAESYTLVTEVSAPGRNTIYVDPQGHNYARYVLFPLDATSAWKPVKETAGLFPAKVGKVSQSAFKVRLDLLAGGYFTAATRKWIIQAHKEGAFGPAFPEPSQAGSDQFPDSAAQHTYDSLGAPMAPGSLAIQTFLEDYPFPSNNWALDMFKVDVQPGTQKGSNPGGDGWLEGVRKFYVKFGDPNTTFSSQRRRLANEVLANQLYRLAGCLAPDARLGIVKDQYGELRIAYCSPWMDNYTEVKQKHNLFTKPAVQTYFAQTLPVDLVLLNWDFTGANYDNILRRVNPHPVGIVELPVGGQVFQVNDLAFLRVDNGGALLYRAQGAHKDFPKIKKKGYKAELDEWRSSANKKELYKLDAGGAQKFYKNLVVGCEQRLKVFEELAKDYHGTALVRRCGLGAQSGKYLTLLHNRAKGFTKYVKYELWKDWGLSAVKMMKDEAAAEDAAAAAAEAPNMSAEPWLDPLYKAGDKILYEGQPVTVKKVYFQKAPFENEMTKVYIEGPGGAGKFIDKDDFSKLGHIPPSYKPEAPQKVDPFKLVLEEAEAMKVAESGIYHKTANVLVTGQGNAGHLIVGIADNGTVGTPAGPLPDGCLIAPVVKVDGKYWFYGTSLSAPVQLFKTEGGLAHRVAQSTGNVEKGASTLYGETKDGNLPLNYMLIYAPTGSPTGAFEQAIVSQYKTVAATGRKAVMEALNKFKKNELSANEFIKLSQNKPWSLSPIVTYSDEEKGEIPVVSTFIKAAGALFTDGNRVLLARRSTNLGPDSRKFQSTTGGDWALPGGKIDPGETALQAAVRETKEELGSVPKYLDTGVRLSTQIPGESGIVQYTTVVLKVSKGAADTYKPKIKGDHAWETDGWAWVPLSEFDILSDDAGNLKAEWHPKIHAGLGLPIEFAEGAPSSIIALLAQNVDEWIAPPKPKEEGTGDLEEGIPFKQNPNGNGHTGWIEDMGQQMLLVDGELAGYVELDEDTDHYVAYTPLDEVIAKVDKWYGPEAQNEAAFAVMEHAGIDPDYTVDPYGYPRRRNPSGYVLSGLRESPLSGSYIEYRPRMPDGSRPRIRVSLESPTVATEQVATELRQYAKGRNLGKYWTSDKEITSGKALSKLGTFTGGKMIWPKWAMPKFAEAASLIYGEKATPKMLFENQLLQIAGLPITEIVPEAEKLIAKVEAEPLPMTLEEVYHQPVGKGVITTKQKKVVTGLKKQLTNILGTSLSKVSGKGAINAEKAKALKQKLNSVITGKKGPDINNEAAAKYLRLLVKAKSVGLWNKYLDPGNMVLYRHVPGYPTPETTSANKRTKEQIEVMKKNGVDVGGLEGIQVYREWIKAQVSGHSGKSYTRYKTKNAYKMVPHEKVVPPDSVSIYGFAQIYDSVSSKPSAIEYGKTYPVPDWVNDVWANVEGFHIDWNGAAWEGGTGPRLESWSSGASTWSGPLQLRARACNSEGFLLLPGAVPPGWTNANAGEREVIHVYSSFKKFPVQVIKLDSHKLTDPQINAYQIAHPAYGKKLGSTIGRCLPKAALKNPSYRSAWAEKDSIGGGWAVVVDDKKVKGQIPRQTTVTDYIFSTETATEPTIQEINRMIDAGMSNAQIGSYLFQKEQEYGREERSHSGAPEYSDEGYLLRNPDAKRVAHNIIDQLGGRPTAMIGAKHLAYGYEGKNKSRPYFSMQFPNRARSKPNYIKVILEPTDTYTIKWGRVQKYDLLDKGVEYDIYAQQLLPIFEEKTGLYLTF